MDRIKFGRTGLMASRSGFGAIPIQRISFDDARHLLRKAYDNGINFFDTARVYSDSEEKIGYALSNVRKDIIIATKSTAADKKTMFEHLETSLRLLKTDYIDIYQLHNPALLSDPEDPNGLYAALLEAREKGMIRFIGITSHRLKVAMEAAASKLYDTIQFPLNSISAKDELNLIAACRENDIGVIAMKGLSGGLITNVPAAFAFLRQYDNVVPIWGMQKESELDEFLSLEKAPPALDQKMLEAIDRDRRELSGSFCRACGYCMPCPVGIPIHMAARMSFLMARAPYQGYLSNEWRNNMELITKCKECGQCRKQCPYGLDTPSVLKWQLKEYREFCGSKSIGC